MSVEGVIPVLVSPMNKDGSPDAGGYRKLLDYIYQYPIGGLWILGSASEDFLISFEHRVQITKIVSEHLAGKSHIIVGCGHPEFSEIERFFDATREMQIDAYHLLPTDRKMKTALTIKYCTMVADRAPKPLWLYNNEKRGLKIAVEAVRELSKHPNIVGIKAAGYDLADILPFCLMSRDDFTTIGSGGGHMPVFLAMGMKAHTISPASCWPEEYCDAWQLWQDGKVDEARKILVKISAVIKALPHPENTEFSAEEKAVLELMGICKRHVHPPYWECTDEEVEQTRKVLEEAGMLPAGIA